jgi:pyruvate dehydrogenase E1 component
MNENYAQPTLPTAEQVAPGAPMRRPSSGPFPGKESTAETDIVRQGILRGMYCVRPSPRGVAHVRLLGAGTILREALAAAELLEADYGVASDVYSVTSFTELRREAMGLERAARLGALRAASWIEQQLPRNGTPVVAVSDYVSSVPDLIRPWIGDRYVALGTDGFGRSDTRASLRAFFEVDRRSIALAALDALDAAAAARARSAWGLQANAAPWTR